LVLKKIMLNNYSTYTFIDRYDTDNAIFHISDKFQFINHIPNRTDLKKIFNSDRIRRYSHNLFISI